MKTVFNTPSGHYKYLVLPFSLTKTPEVYQELMNHVLRDLLNSFVFVYIDDILIFSKSLEKRAARPGGASPPDGTLALRESREVRVPCVFRLLGYIRSPGSIQMDPTKVSAVLKWLAPVNNCTGSWGLPTSTGVSSGTTVPWWCLSLP